MDYKNLKDKLLNNKFKHIIAADIASDVIQIAVVNCSKRINTVEKLISKQLPQELAADAYVFNKEKLAAFINEILKEVNISTGVLVFTAGADKTALLNLQLPYLKEQELREAAKWEIIHELGSSAEEFCYAAVYNTHLKEELNRVTAVVMPENIYQVMDETAVKTELPLGGIFLRSLSIEQTFAKNYTDFLLCDYLTDDECVLTAFAGGMPALQKTVNVFDGEFLAAEIKTIISALPDIEFKQVVLNCDDSLKRDILSSEIALPVIKNDISHSVGFNECLQAESLQHLNSFAAAIGAALCLANNSKFNLAGHSENGFSLPRCKIYRGAAVFAVVFMLAFWGWQLAELFIVQQQLKEIDGKIAASAVWQQRYEESAALNIQINRRLKFAGNIKKQSITWNELLNDISSAVPQGCWLERIEQKENKKQINVTGYAASIDKAVEFTEMLSGKKANLKTELTELKTEELNGKQYTAFNVLIERR